jgi:hypothetical protein
MRGSSRAFGACSYCNWSVKNSSGVLVVVMDKLKSPL